MPDNLKISNFSQLYFNMANQKAIPKIPNSSNNSAGKTPDDEKLRAACSEMESFFIGYLMKEMRATIDKSELLSGGKGEEMFTSMLDTEIAKKSSAAGGIGLSEILMEQLTRQNRKNDP